MWSMIMFWNSCGKLNFILSGEFFHENPILCKLIKKIFSLVHQHNNRLCWIVFLLPSRNYHIVFHYHFRHEILYGVALHFCIQFIFRSMAETVTSKVSSINNITRQLAFTAMNLLRKLFRLKLRSWQAASLGKYIRVFSENCTFKLCESIVISTAK